MHIKTRREGVRRGLAVFLAVMLALTVYIPFAPVANAGTPVASVDFAVLSTTDMHGKVWDENLLTGGSVGNSMLKVASAVYDIREDIGANNVVLIDNGDEYQGTPVTSYHIAQDTNGNAVGPNPMALSLKYIGYNAVELGNHEFNYNWGAMNHIYDYLQNNTTSYGAVDVLAANVYKPDETNAFTPYITKNITVGSQTFKIGVLGLVNADCTRWDVPANFNGYTIATDSAVEVNKYVPQMKAAGCDFIVLSYHSGMGTTSGALQFGINTEDQIARVIATTRDVDMVIAGHDHSTSYSNHNYKNADNEDVLVVNAGGTDLTKSVFTATLNSDNSFSVTPASSTNVPLSGYTGRDADTDAYSAALKDLIKPYADNARSFVSQPVGTLTGTWNTVGNFYLQQSDTMDLINRAQIAEGSKHLAQKYPAGATRNDLFAATGLDHLTVDLSATSVAVDGTYNAAAGDFSMKNIYQMYKYDNTLYLVPVTGSAIKDMLENNAQNHLSVSISGGAAHYSTINDDFANPVFYGLNFTYDMAQPAGSRVTITGFADGTPFDPAKKYIIAINNYHLGNSHGPFAGLSTANAIWSQNDDMSGATVQNLIADFVSDETETNGGVSPSHSTSYPNWRLTYSGSLGDDLSNTTYIAYASETAPADGDTVIIYYNAGGTAVSSVGSGKLSPSAVTVNGSVLYANATTAAFDVNYDSTKGGYTLVGGGKYLTSGPTGNSLSLTDTANDYSYWTFIAADGGWVAQNKNAVGGGKPQSLEFYQGSFTTYGFTGTPPAAYVYSFYKVIPTATLMTAAPADGDQFVIWYNAGNQIVGSTPVSGKLAGVNSTAAGNVLPVPTNSAVAVFTAQLDSGTGCYYYITDDGKYLTSSAGGNGLSLTDAADPPDATNTTSCSLWVPAAVDGGWHVRNAGALYNGQANQGLEFWSGFTTYGLDNSSKFTYNFYKFNGYAPAAPQNNQDQTAPTGLTGIAPTTASNNDGQITGTTTDMEYKLSTDTNWTACPGTSITGLFPGSYEVRLAAKTGYNASPSTTVTVPSFGPSSYAVKDLTLQPGANESAMNFCWYSNSTLTTAAVQVAQKSAMTGTAFPVSSATTFSGTSVASGSFKSTAVSVTGLAAGTEYVYRVGDGTNYSGVYSFKTHDADTYRALFVGDPQIGSSGNDTNDAASWRDTVSDALTQNPNASFILSAGDQVENGASETEYDGFFSPTELASMPVAPTVGNHDTSSSMYANHFNSPNESTTDGVTPAGGDYWFTYGNTLFMVLNSNDTAASEHDAFIGGAIAAAGSDIKWKVVMFHHSLYSSAEHSLDSDISGAGGRRETFVPILDKYDIDVVLSGHDHCYTRSFIMKANAAQSSVNDTEVTDPDGTLYITADSSSGSKFYPFEEADAAYRALRWQENEPTYSTIDVTDSSFTITTYVADTNEQIDTFTINNTAPTGLVGVALSKGGANDGQITGTTTAMEYKKSSDSTWTPCTGTSITGLAAGVYNVRYAANATTGAPASPATKVTVTAITKVAMTLVQQGTMNPTNAKGFAWYTVAVPGESSDLQVVRKTGPSASFTGTDVLTFHGAVTATATNSSNESKGQEYLHKATATGLSADTTYYFRVGDASSGLWSQTGTFTTAPSTGAFTFLDLADPQAKELEEAELSASTFEAAADMVPNADFIAINGDLVDTGSTEYQWDWLFNNMSDVMMNYTLAPVAGNHESQPNAFINHFNLTPASGSAITSGVYYSYDYSNVHFVMLNTNENSTAYNDFSQAQVDWMQADISAAKAAHKWVIVVLHKGPYTTSNHATDSDIMGAAGVRTLIAPIFENLGVDLVLQGHDHIYARSKAINVTGGTPAAGRPTVITEIVSGEQTQYQVDPDGTVYLIPSTAGPKVYYKNSAASLGSAYYGLFDNADESHAAVYGQDPADSTRPMRSMVDNFESITIDGTKLTVISYEIDHGGLIAQTEDPYIIDTFGIVNNDAQTPPVDDGGGHGGGGNGGNLPTQTNTSGVDTSNNVVKTTVTGTSDSNGNITASVDSNTAQSLIDSAKTVESAGGTATVSITVQGTAASGSTEVGIGKDDFKNIATQTNANVALTTSVGTVTFDSKAVEAIAGSATDDLKINITKVDTSTYSDDVKAEVGDRPVYDFSITSGNSKITDFGGGSAQINLPYTLKAGEDPDAIVVYYLDASHNLITVRGVYDTATGKVNFVAPHFSSYVIGYNKVAFADVSGTAWYASPITFIAARSITTGVDSTHFAPDQSITRGQFIVMLLKAYGISPLDSSADNFADAGSTYYTGYLAAAKKLGITVGVGGNMFAPESQISRQETFTLAYRTLDILGELPTASNGKTINSFSDSASVADYSKEAFNAFVEAGIANGSAGKLNPASNCSRAEMAQIIYNLLTV